jgi:hypothetical protein
MQSPDRQQSHEFLSDEQGSSTAEFVIWAPLIMLVGVSMFVLSYYAATASEVQQVAHEVARSSVGLGDGGKLSGDLCETMSTDVLPSVASRMALVEARQFAPIPACPAFPDTESVVRITVTYDLRGTAVHSLGRLIGFDFGTVTRTSELQL